MKFVYEVWLDELTEALVEQLVGTGYGATHAEVVQSATEHTLRMTARKSLHRTLAEVGTERMRQDAKWGGPEHDDCKSPDNWCRDIEAYLMWARQMADMGNPDKYRSRMLQVAALAVAACETLDRWMETPR